MSILFQQLKINYIIQSETVTTTFMLLSSMSNIFFREENTVYFQIGQVLPKWGITVFVQYDISLLLIEIFPSNKFLYFANTLRISYWLLINKQKLYYYFKNITFIDYLGFFDKKRQNFSEKFG